MNFNVIKSLIAVGATIAAGIAVTSVIAYKSKRMGMQEMFINTVEGALNAMPHDGQVVKFDDRLMMVVDGDVVITVNIAGDGITVKDETGLITIHSIDETDLVNNVVYDIVHASEYFHISGCDCDCCSCDNVDDKSATVSTDDEIDKSSKDDTKPDKK